MLNFLSLCLASHVDCLLNNSTKRKSTILQSNALGCVLRYDIIQQSSGKSTSDLHLSDY